MQHYRDVKRLAKMKWSLLFVDSQTESRAIIKISSTNTQELDDTRRYKYKQDSFAIRQSGSPPDWLFLVLRSVQ